MADGHLIIVRQHFTSLVSGNLQISSHFLNLVNGGIFNSFKSFLNSKIFGDTILWVEVVAG